MTKINRAKLDELLYEITQKNVHIHGTKDASHVCNKRKKKEYDSM